ncbi:hypothetical protein X798_07644, partial [Onchocerca flexuosa]
MHSNLFCSSLPVGGVTQSCKSFHELASKLLNVRNKPPIITNGTVSDAIDQQIFSTYEKAGKDDFLK